MPEDLIRITPNLERAKSILAMVEIRLKAVALLNPEEFMTIIVEDYYEIIKELLTALLAAEGYKTLSHTTLIEYVRTNHKNNFTELETITIDELRKLRNRITYEGFMVKKDFLQRKEPVIKPIIAKLQEQVKRLAK
jgi:hypothetical protein